MFRRLLLSLLLVCSTVACAEDDAQREGPHPALWEVRSADGQVAGWLFGTVHALPDDTVWRFAALDRAIEGSSVLVVEVADLANANKVADIFRRTASDSAPGLPVEQRIDPSLRSQYGELLRRSDADGAMLDSMESWAAALTLASFARVNDTANGVDRALLAAYEERPIVELEGAERQLATFDRLPEKEQRDLLDAVLLEAQDARTEPKAIVDAWLTGDVDGLTLLTEKGILADPELRQTLLIDRNRDWAMRISQLMRSGERPFVAVGAGHMPGEDGLPALLRERGYEVRRLP